MLEVPVLVPGRRTSDSSCVLPSSKSTYYKYKLQREIGDNEQCTMSREKVPTVVQRYDRVNQILLQVQVIAFFNIKIESEVDPLFMRSGTRSYTSRLCGNCTVYVFFKNIFVYGTDSTSNLRIVVKVVLDKTRKSAGITMFNQINHIFITIQSYAINFILIV